MALLDPSHRVTTLRTPSRPAGGLHPAIGLAAGFGFIVAGALAVHVVFNALI